MNKSRVNLNVGFGERVPVRVGAAGRRETFAAVPWEIGVILHINSLCLMIKLINVVNSLFKHNQKNGGNL